MRKKNRTSSLLECPVFSFSFYRAQPVMSNVSCESHGLRVTNICVSGNL